MRACIVLVCFANAQAPRELLGKVVKGDHQSQVALAKAKIVIEESGGQTATDNNGLFHLFLPDAFRPGDDVTISVDAPGYAVYQPPGGKLRIPIDLLRTRVLIHLLPKGSLKFLSEAQLRAFVERTAKESNSQTSQQDLRVRPDLSRYLKEWAIQYGFSVDEVRAELDHWAAEVASRKASSYDLSLAAFANQNFREANKRALDAAAEAESKLTSLEKEQHAAVDRIVQAYHLAGDAAYNALDFDNAERAYDKALAHTNRNLAATQWADLQLRIGNCERELSYLSEGVAITRHAESARKAYDLALEV